MKIAMIEDHPTTLMVNEVMLKKQQIVLKEDEFHGYQTADDFLEFVDKMGVNYFDIVIADNDLGENQKTGFDIISLMRTNGFKGKPILLTGDDSVSMGLKMKLNRGVEYIVKNNKPGPEGYLGKLSESIGNARETNG